MDDDFSAENLAKQRAIRAEAARKAQEEALKQDPELQAIIFESRQVQKDTLSSTQNSVRTIKNTMGVADKTAEELDRQGRQLDSIEQKAEQADANATDSYQSARELHKYKGMIPLSIKNMFTGGKKSSEDDKLKKANKSLDREGATLEKNSAAQRAAIAKVAAVREAASTGLGEEADEVERQIESNLGEISAGLDHLQMQAVNMNKELQAQNVTIKRIGATTEHTDYTLNSANRKIQEFL